MIVSNKTGKPIAQMPKISVHNPAIAPNIPPPIVAGTAKLLQTPPINSGAQHRLDQMPGNS
jgi:hypothetical protein